MYRLSAADQKFDWTTPKILVVLDIVTKLLFVNITNPPVTKTKILWCRVCVFFLFPIVYTGTYTRVYYETNS